MVDWISNSPLLLQIRYSNSVARLPMLECPFLLILLMKVHSFSRHRVFLNHGLTQTGMWLIQVGETGNVRWKLNRQRGRLFLVKYSGMMRRNKRFGKLLGRSICALLMETSIWIFNKPPPFLSLLPRDICLHNGSEFLYIIFVYRREIVNKILNLLFCCQWSLQILR